MNLEGSRWNEDFPDTGYLETYFSGMGLATKGRKVLPHGNGSEACTLAEKRDARYIFDALRQGDPQARAFAKKSFVMLGVGVANVVSGARPRIDCVGAARSWDLHSSASK
jgi:predicted NBD/HSP70 family sugar kinase